MTDPHEPCDDELLSADLDGAADSAERARIVGDPQARARQDQLRAAAALVGQSVEPLPGPTVDTLIARALDAAGSADDVGPIPLRPPTGRRRRLPPPWSVAATILILVVVGLSLVWRGRAAPHATTAARTARAPASAAASGAPSAAPSSSAAGSSASTAPQSLDRQSLSATGATTDLGSFSNDVALRTALRNGLPRPAGASAAGAPPAIAPTAVSRCATVIENTGLPVAQRLQVAVARVAGQPLIVFEYRASAAATPTTGAPPPGSSGVVRTLIAVVDPATCKPRVLFVRP